MAFLLKSWLINKAVGKVNVGQSQEDPYYENIPREELGIFQKEGARRKKALPTGLSKNDQKALKGVRSGAYHLDLAFECCCGCKVGWAGIIGLIPWIGDMIAAFFAIRLVQKAENIDGGLPAYIRTQMMANVAFDFGIGLIPLVGDLINIAYKANTRNCILLETHLIAKVEREHGVASKECFGRFRHGEHPDPAQQPINSSTGKQAHENSQQNPTSAAPTREAPIQNDVGGSEPPLHPQRAGKRAQRQDHTLV